MAAVVENTYEEIWKPYNPATDGFIRGHDVAFWKQRIAADFGATVEHIEIVQRNSPRHTGVRFRVWLRYPNGSFRDLLIRVIMPLEGPMLNGVGSLFLELRFMYPGCSSICAGWALESEPVEDYLIIANAFSRWDHVFRPQDIRDRVTDRAWMSMVMLDAKEFSNRLRSPKWPSFVTKRLVEGMWGEPKYVLNCVPWFRACSWDDPTLLHPAVGQII
jgi:hypothetical protein